MRRTIIGAAAVVGLLISLAFSSPAQAGPGALLDKVPTPCGGGVPCGTPDERAEAMVAKVLRMCPRSYCELP